MSRVRRNFVITDEAVGLGKTFVIDTINSELGVGIVSFKNECKSFKNVFTAWIEDSEETNIGLSTYVASVEDELQSFPASLPPRFIQSEKKWITWLTPGTGWDGTLWQSGQHYLNSYDIPGVAGTTFGNHPDDTFGFIPGTSLEQEDGVQYASNYLGRNVDIVTLEAYSSEFPAVANFHSTNPDYRDPDDNSLRAIPMDWPDLEFADNNQVTSGKMLAPHASSVLSVAGGVINGFAKKATLRAMYANSNIDDDFVEAINALTSWHNSKSNNPDTGVPNPTIMVGEWQSLADVWHGMPIDSVQKITIGGVDVATRPGASWGNDFTPFIDNGIIPYRVFNDVTASNWEWCITTPIQGENTPVFTALQAAMDAGIIFINAAGNNGGTYAKRGTTLRDATLTYDTDVSVRAYNINYIGITTTTNSSTTYKPFLSYGPHGLPDAIDVAAGQNSETYPTLDGYTNRGPGIDIVGLGADTWAADAGGNTYADGSKWGMFSGTSCATPSVVGIAACYMEKYFHETGSWPNSATVKRLLQDNARDIVVGATTSFGNGLIDWSNMGSVSPSSVLEEPKLYTSQTLINRIHPQFWNGNGGYRRADLAGTTTKRAFWRGSFTRKVAGRRPLTGVVYPRPKIRRTSS